MNSLTSYSVFVTHGGMYHADDVISACLINIITGVKHTFIRVLDTELEAYQNRTDCFIFDTGGGEFDHHQDDVKCYEDGSKYCAAALIADAYLPEYFKQNALTDSQVNKAMKRAHEVLLRPVSLQDNYGLKKGNLFSQSIAALNRVGDFNFAVKYTEPFVEGLLTDIKSDSVLIDQYQLDTYNEPILITNRFIPTYLVNADYVKFLVSKSSRGTWNVTSSDYKRYPVNVQVGSDGCVFVHATKFMAAFNTEAAAISKARFLAYSGQ